MKTLLIRPADVSMRPFGPTSSVAAVEVSVSYDRDVSVDSGLFAAGGVPLVETSIPTDGLKVPILPNDDPSIVAGAGFSILVHFTYSPRRGRHGQDLATQRRIVIASSDPDTVPLASKSDAKAMATYGDGSANSGVAVWTNPQTGERIPYLTAPSLGYLTTIGA